MTEKYLSDATLRWYDELKTFKCTCNEYVACIMTSTNAIIATSSHFTSNKISTV